MNDLLQDTLPVENPLLPPIQVKKEIPTVDEALADRLNVDGSLPGGTLQSMTGEYGQRMGIVPAESAGAGEIGRGFRRGLLQWVSSKANTFGLEDIKRSADYEMATNQQLFPANSKGTLANILNRASGTIGAVGPDIAAGIVASAVTGGLGAAPAVASGVGEAATFVSMAAGMWGDNEDRLEETMPEVDPATRLGLNLILTPLSSALFTYMGPEGKTVAEASTIMALKGLKAGDAGALRALGMNSMGALGRFVTEYGKSVGTGVGATVASQAANDILTGIVDPKMTEDQFVQKIQSYPKLILDSSIDMIGMALLPSTLNAIKEYSARRYGTDIALMSKKNEEVVNPTIPAPEGSPRMVIDTGLRDKTEAVFMDMEKNLPVTLKGVKQKDAIYSPMIQLVRTLAYHFAAEQKRSGLDATARPEKFVKDLSTLVVNDKVHGPALIALADDEPAQIAYINKNIGALAKNLYSVRQSANVREHEASLVGLRQMLKDSAPILDESRKASLSSDLGKALSGQVKPEEGATVVIPARLLVKAIGPANAELAKSAYVDGEFRSIEIDGKKYDLKIDKDFSGLLMPEGTLASDKTLLEQASKAVADETGFNATRDSARLASLRAETLRLQDQLTRAQNFDNLWAGKVMQSKAVEASLFARQQAEKAKQAELEAQAKAGDKAALAVMMKMRREPDGGPLGSSSQEKGGKMVGQYNRARQLMLFYANHDPSTLVHEWFHHLYENDLANNTVLDALRTAYSVKVQGRDEWTLASKENAANAFAQYVLEGKLPANADALYAFNYLKNVLGTHWKEMKTYMQNGKDTFLGDEKLVVPDKVKAKFDEALGNITPDLEAQLFGSALTKSLEVGDVTGPVEVSDATVKQKAAKIAQAQGRTIDQVILDKLSRNPEAFGDKRNLSELTPDQKLALQDMIGFEDAVANPVEPEKSTGPLASHELDRATISMMDEKLIQKKVFGFVGRETNLTGDALRQAVRVKAMEMFGPEVATMDKEGETHVLSNLSKKQLLQLMDFVRPDEPGKAEIPDLQSKVDAVAGDFIENGNLRTQLPDHGPIAKRLLSNAKAMLTSKVRWLNSKLPSAYQLAEILVGHDEEAPLIKTVMRPIYNDVNVGHQALKVFKDKVYRFLLENNIPMHEIEKQVGLAGTTFRNSDAIGIYTATDFGKDLARTDIVNMKKSWSYNLTDSHIKAAISLVEKTPWMKKLAHFMSDTQNEETLLTAPAFLRNTGKELKLREGAYMTRMYQDGSVHETDPFSVLNQNGGFDAVRFGLKSPTGKSSGEAGIRQQMDSFNAFLHHTAMMIEYRHQADGIREGLTILSDPKVTDSFMKQFGDTDYLDALKAMLSRELSPSGKLRPDNEYDSFFRGFNSNAAATYLPYSAGAIGAQPISILTGMAMLPWKEGAYFAWRAATNIGRIFGTIPAILKGEHPLEAYRSIPDIQFVLQHSPAVMEGLKTRSELALTEASATGGLNSIRFGKMSFAKYKDVGMYPMNLLDAAVRAAMYRTAFDVKMSDLAKVGKTGPEAVARAEYEAARSVRLSSNPSTKGERGLYQSEGNEVVKGMMLFMSSQMAQLNMLLYDNMLPFAEAVRKDWAGKTIKETAKVLPSTMRKLAFGAFLPGIALGMLSRRRMQKDMDEVIKDAFIGGIVATLPIIGNAYWAWAVFGLGDGSGSVKITGIWEDTLNKVSNALNHAVSGDFTFNDFRQVGDVIHLWKGAPRAPWKFMTSIYSDLEIDGKKMDMDTLGRAIGLLRKEE